MGFVRGDDDQGVLEHPLLLQSGQKEVEGIVEECGAPQLWMEPLAPGVIVGQGVGMVRPHGKERQKPRGGLTPGAALPAFFVQGLDLFQALEKEIPIVDAPIGKEGGRSVVEPFLAPDFLEADQLHEAVFIHEAQSCGLKVGRAVAVPGQDVRQGVPGRGRGVREQFLGDQRSVGQSWVIGAEHRIKSVDGLIPMRQKVGDPEPQLGPAAHLRHGEIRGPVDELHVLRQVTAGYALQDDEEDIGPFGGPGRHRDAGQIVRQLRNDAGKLLLPREEGDDLLEQGIGEFPAPEAEQLADEGQKKQMGNARAYRDELEVHAREQQAEGEQEDHRQDRRGVQGRQEEMGVQEIPRLLRRGQDVHGREVGGREGVVEPPQECGHDTGDPGAGPCLDGGGDQDADGCENDVGASAQDEAPGGSVPCLDKNETKVERWDDIDQEKTRAPPHRRQASRFPFGRAVRSGANDMPFCRGASTGNLPLFGLRPSGTGPLHGGLGLDYRMAPRRWSHKGSVSMERRTEAVVPRAQ